MSTSAPRTNRRRRARRRSSPSWRRWGSSGPRSPPTRSDLHTHTVASDGTLTADALVALAAGAGVGVLAVTDHDSLEAVPAAVAAGDRLGVRVVAGVELSVRAPSGSMHLVAYFPGATPPLLTRRLAELRRARERRAALIVARLDELGVPVRWGDVADRAGGAIGRPHIADALVAAGHVRSRQEAFDRYLADGGDAWIPHEGLDAEEAVRLVADAGGASALAHPATLRMGDDRLAGFVQRLAAAGMAGIEVHRPEHTAERRDAYARLAARFGLVPSGGSDFHDPAGPVRPGDTGDPPLPADTAERLFAAAGI